MLAKLAACPRHMQWIESDPVAVPPREDPDGQPGEDSCCWQVQSTFWERPAVHRKPSPKPKRIHFAFVTRALLATSEVRGAEPAHSRACLPRLPWVT